MAVTATVTATRTTNNRMGEGKTKTRRQSIAMSGFGPAVIVTQMEQCRPSSTNVQGVLTLVAHIVLWRVSR
jgi:hypothetical protein